MLGIDLIDNPAPAAKPEYAFQTAALYWESHGLNELAEAQGFVTRVKRMNGCLNRSADGRGITKSPKAFWPQSLHNH